jgi:hypothetical protein
MEVAVSAAALAACPLASTAAAALAPTTALAMKFRRETSLARACESCLFRFAPMIAPFAWLAALAAPSSAVHDSRMPNGGLATPLIPLKSRL